ncbi:MAG: phage head closure protein [Rhodopseudomonas sp.]|nr:phage head closure protein [Rhodopseudomonas sp.]
MNIGDLNRRLVLQAPVDSDDGEGGYTRTYDVVATLWGQVTPLSARPDDSAGGLGAVLRFRIVLRARDDIGTRHRLLDGAHIYRVVAVRPSADRRFTEIDAEERQD